MAYLQVDAGLIASHVWGLQLLYEDDDDADEKHKVNLRGERKADSDLRPAWDSLTGPSPARQGPLQTSLPLTESFKQRKTSKKRILHKNLEIKSTESKPGGRALSEAERKKVMEKR